MQKDFVWNETTQLRDGDEQAGYAAALEQDTLDMKLDVIMTDDRKNKSVNCYRSTFLVTRKEYNAMSANVLADFGINSYITRYSVYLNGTKVGCAVCAGYAQKYTLPKTLFCVGENDVCIIVEQPAGTRVWEGIFSAIVHPTGYVSEKASLPECMTVYSYQEPPRALRVKDTKRGVWIELSKRERMTVRLYERGIVRFKYPHKAENVMDNFCTDRLSKNLRMVRAKQVTQTETHAEILTDYVKIVVTFFPFSIEIFDLSSRLLQRVEGVKKTECDVGLLELSLQEDEHIFGLGENAVPTLDKRGQVAVNWVVHHPDKSHIPVPYFISTEGYGFYLNTAYHSTFDMGKTYPDKALVYANTTKLDWFFFPGETTADIVTSYAKITGIVPLPPKSLFGFWQAGLNTQDQRFAMHSVKFYQYHNIPLDGLGIDSRWQLKNTYRWDVNHFPDHRGFINFLRNHKLDCMLWIAPFFTKGFICHKCASQYNFALRDEKDKPHPATYWRSMNTLAVDFRNPKAYTYLHTRLYLRLEIDRVPGFHLDCGDSAEIPVTMKTSEGLQGDQLHNLHPFFYGQSVWSLLAYQRSIKRPYVSQVTGYAGSGRYACFWGSGYLAEFQYMRTLLKAGQACGLMNIPFWGPDIAGTCRTPNTDEEFFIRSYQWGCLSPLSRANGARSEPWAYGSRAFIITRRFIRMRYALLPYLYSCAHEVYLYQKPIMAPLMYYHLKDARTYDRDYQYYLGKNLMIAPAYKSDGNEDMSCDIDIYFPEGRWLDANSGTIYEGHTKIDYHVPIEILPMFIRMGAIIPYTVQNTNVKEFDAGFLSVAFFPTETKERFDFFEDDGTTQYYQMGYFSCISFTCQKVENSISLGVSNLNSDYMPTYVGEFVFRIFSETAPDSITVNGEPFSYIYDETTHYATGIYRFEVD